MMSGLSSSDPPTIGSVCRPLHFAEPTLFQVAREWEPRRAQTISIHPWREAGRNGAASFASGTEGSNLAPSSGESAANLTSSIMVGADARSPSTPSLPAIDAADRIIDESGRRRLPRLRTLNNFSSNCDAAHPKESRLGRTRLPFIGALVRTFYGRARHRRYSQGQTPAIARRKLPKDQGVSRDDFDEPAGHLADGIRGRGSSRVQDWNKITGVPVFLGDLKRHPYRPQDRQHRLETRSPDARRSACANAIREPRAARYPAILRRGPSITRSRTRSTISPAYPRARFYY